MTDLYSEWRDFYAEKVRSWMSLEELRAECGKLQTVDNPSPEVLLVHAMHALEEYVQRNEALEQWRQAVRAMEASIDAVQPAAVDGAIDKARFERAPCYLCGYNGPGYYRPDTHPCAAKYHAAQEELHLAEVRVRELARKMFGGGDVR